VCCLLVLNSATSTPQWIRQPGPRDDAEAAEKEVSFDRSLLIGLF